MGNTFLVAFEFRKSVRHANILKVKDLEFKKNERKQIVAVYKDKSVSIGFMRGS